MSWLAIKDAPLETPGNVWSPDKSWGNRTDQVGTVRAYASGRRFVTGHFHGFKITHWHPLPKPPKIKRVVP